MYFFLPLYDADSSFVPPLIYAFMGSLKDIVIRPVAMVSLFLGTLLQDEIDPSKDPINYLCLAFTTIFFVEITEVMFRGASCNLEVQVISTCWMVEVGCC